MMTPRLVLYLALIILLLSVGACVPTRLVKPLDEKEKQAGLSFGGPLITQFGPPIPIPLISVSGAYGLKKNTSVFGGLHLTSALYGNVQMDAGLCYEVLAQKSKIPGISISPSAQLIFHPKGAAFRFYPQIDANFYWEYGKKKNLFYFSVGNWIELSAQKAHAQKQENRLLIMPALGHTFKKKKWSYQVEARLIAPNLSNKDIVVPYWSPVPGRGAMGVYVQIARKF